MQHTAQWTDLSDSTRKFVHRWQPDNEPSGVVCIVHGLGEHGGRYARLAEDFVGNELTVIALDQTGHGRSPGKKGCIETYDALLEDIGELIGWTRRNFPELPICLFGHSMGGNLVLNYVLRKPDLPQCVISSSPMIRSAREPGKVFERLARLVLLLAPNLRLKSNVDPARLMSHPEEQRAFEQDELFHSRLSLQLGAALIDSGRWLLENASKLSVPTLITHGTKDYLTCHEASAEFAALAGDMCELEIYNDQLHDTFRDLERERVIERFIDFIRSNSPQVAA